MIALEQLRAQVPDVLVEPLRDAVVGMWEADTGIRWARVTDAEEIIYMLADEKTIELPVHVVTAVASVFVRDYSIDNWSELALAYDYDFRPTRYLTRLDTPWEAQVKVTYTGGYADGAAPPFVEKALLVQAQFLAERLDNLTVKSQNFEGGQGVFETADRHPLYRLAVANAKRIVI